MNQESRTNIFRSFKPFFSLVGANTGFGGGSERGRRETSGVCQQTKPRTLRSRCLRSGFSIAEMLIVLGVSAIITTIVVGVFAKAPGRQALDKQTSVVLSLLEHARGLTLSAKNASTYGVHFETSKAVLFTGPTYSANAASNVV